MTLSRIKNQSLDFDNTSLDPVLRSCQCQTQEDSGTVRKGSLPQGRRATKQAAHTPANWEPWTPQGLLLLSKPSIPRQSSSIDLGLAHALPAHRMLSAISLPENYHPSSLASDVTFFLSLS